MIVKIIPNENIPNDLMNILIIWAINICIWVTSLVTLVTSEAVEKSSPFKPLPKEFKGDGVRIRFKFDFDASFERPKEQ